MRQYSPHNALLATDMAQSVLRRGQALRAYAPFGHVAGQQREAAFTGQLSESRLYLLGNGYRAYSPGLKRFMAPDALSPFGRGGPNTYAYCGGDPVNRTDNQGNRWLTLLGSVFSKAKVAKSTKLTQALESVSTVQSNSTALKLTYIGRGQGRVLRFATDVPAKATPMYEALGAHLTGSQGAFGVMVRNAGAVKAGAKAFEPLPGYAPLRDPSLFERAIELQHASWMGTRPIKPVSPGDWSSLPASLDLQRSDVRRTVLSYLYYQELADPKVVAARGRVDPWISIS